MKTIWKYDIKPASKQEIAMPEGAVILTVQTQRGSPCLWVEVETTKQLEGRVFEIFERPVGIGDGFAAERFDHLCGWRVHVRRISGKC